ncbi:hypothetical protein LC609_29740 [Nostoc sp. XA013]|nr:hypothetical protein [Nostoc sp. XA013]
MVKSEDGYFHAQLKLKYGIYQCKFRVQSKSPKSENDEWVDGIDPNATDINETEKFSMVRIKNGQRIIDSYGMRVIGTL